ncbi:dTDP-glucose 4,6-dehydratase [Candidatus Neomarinimicrobiota bacterium]
MTDNRRRFLVTGGAGFIGGNFVAKVMGENLGEILVLDKLTYAGHLATLKSWEGNSAYRFVKGDIGDRELVHRLLREFQPMYIVNFAAESHVDRSIESAEDFINTNIVGTYALIDETLSYWSECCDGASDRLRFHHVSTDEVYGSLGFTGAFTERTPYAPNSPYAASKASSDHLVRAYFKTHKLPATITNCSNNYGPFQFPEKLIPLVLMNALEGKSIPVYGDGMNVRDWLFVEDHCEAILRVLAHGQSGEVYNVGGHCEMTNLDLLQTLFTCLNEQVDLIREYTEYNTDVDYPSLIEFVPDRPGHDRRYAIDAGKIQRELGWKPKENLHSGLTKTVKWYITHMDWSQEVLSDNYTRQRLGLQRTTESS